jgi:dihydrodipicolinate synthase/N-acetylneuraminate lyase
MPQPLFRGVCATSITPFRPDGRLWRQRFPPHIDRLIGARVDALSPLGSSGEFPAMECTDRERLLSGAVEAMAGRGCGVAPRFAWLDFRHLQHGAWSRTSAV